MTAELYQMISIVCFVLAGVLLLLSIVLFIKFRIPKVIGELSGTTERKAIAAMYGKNKQEHDTTLYLEEAVKSHTNITEKIARFSPETEVLAASTEETTILSDNPVQNKGLVIEDDIIFVHTNEIIC